MTTDSPSCWASPSTWSNWLSLEIGMSWTDTGESSSSCKGPSWVRAANTQKFPPFTLIFWGKLKDFPGKLVIRRPEGDNCWGSLEEPREVVDAREDRQGFNGTVSDMTTNREGWESNRSLRDLFNCNPLPTTTFEVAEWIFGLYTTKCMEMPRALPRFFLF